ncbi:Flp pilus assembly protein CpaB [Sulfitobacter aestuariivivens]|uniref:Flp pilus assembly protein CpaB n=1 Tax=Sulfitobacter aestuariivivens TaxID=2766981 RepID=A0A927D2D1_9RHOB|nr:Flp pilus assembly protein CpaB [Sulfitobacter aestuariivivens]MBD3663840.1 Flp pilus assembly protein CpaB [Sulfitobacter aestuariivivens]
MRMVFGLVLLVGIALAGGAVYLAKDRIAQYQVANAQAQAALAQVVPTKPVFVATGPLKYGQRLKEEDVRVVQWPVNAIPEGAFLNLDAEALLQAEAELLEIAELIPDFLPEFEDDAEEEAYEIVSRDPLFPDNTTKQRVVLRTIEKGEAILTVKVTEPGEDTGLTSRLEPGKRAYALKVDVSSGVSGFLRPGDRVDVYWTGRVNLAGDGDKGEVTKLIEAGVKLIAIDQSAGRQLDEAVIASTVTVSATPQQVAALAQAQQTGKLSLSLVGAEDTSIATAIEVDQRSLLGIATAEIKAEVAKEQVCTIRTRRGAEVVELPIPCTN